MPEIGFLNVAWWVPIAYLVLAGHVTNTATTIYLHRAMTHRGVLLHDLVSIPMRFWLWLSTGIVTKEWVACHRKHHAYPDREGDPHSPVNEGLWSILLLGWAHYRSAVRDAAVLEKYGKDTPDDWWERWIFSRFSYTGVALMAVIDVYLLGLGVGLIVFVIQVAWMPMLGALVNGVGHAMGYRNFAVKDESRNFFPIGILLGGEELHNNHHADPRSAKFKARWWEFDIGWLYIKILSRLGLATVVYARD